MRKFQQDFLYILPLLEALPMPLFRTTLLYGVLVELQCSTVMGGAHFHSLLLPLWNGTDHQPAT